MRNCGIRLVIGLRMQISPSFVLCMWLASHRENRVFPICKRFSRANQFRAMRNVCLHTFLSVYTYLVAQLMRYRLSECLGPDILNVNERSCGSRAVCLLYPCENFRAFRTFAGRSKFVDQRVHYARLVDRALRKYIGDSEL